MSSGEVAVRGWRLARQRLVAPARTSPAEVVAWLGAVQAQDFAGAKWSIGLRLPGVTEAEVEAAVDRGELARGWPLRGTLHLVAAADLRWMTALVAPRVLARAAPRFAQLGLTEATVRRSQAALREALRGGRRLTREEVNAAFTGAGIALGGQRSIHLLLRAALDGLTCFGPRRGKQHTFVLAEGWLPEGRPLPRTQALGELAWRYFRAHGPATSQDFQWWSGLAAADVREALAAAGDRLTASPSDGRPRHGPRDPGQRGRAGGHHLLPGFDGYLLAYQDRGAVLAPAFAPRLSDGGGILKPTLVARGQVVGVWRRTLAAHRVEVEATPLERLGVADRQAFERAARRYGRFLGLEARLSWGASQSGSSARP